MDVKELRAKVDEVAGYVAGDMPAAKTPEEAKFGMLLMLGIGIVGELLVDIKRIADAAEGKVAAGPPESDASYRRRLLALNLNELDRSAIFTVSGEALDVIGSQVGCLRRRPEVRYL